MICLNIPCFRGLLPRMRKTKTTFNYVISPNRWVHFESNDANSWLLDMNHSPMKWFGWFRFCISLRNSLLLLCVCCKLSGQTVSICKHCSRSTRRWIREKSRRLFWGLGDAYQSASGGSVGKGFNTHDVRELIPEMFCADCFLANPNRFVFGERQGGEIVDQVLIPFDPRHFVARHRRLLDKSERLCEWIDLIFGCDQRSIKKTNVFHPYSYSSEFDKAVAAAAAAKRAEKKKEKKNRTEKKKKKRRLTTRSEAMRSHVREYGVTPKQLFETRPHSKRVTKYEATIAPLSALTEQNVSFEILSVRLNQTRVRFYNNRCKTLDRCLRARGSWSRNDDCVLRKFLVDVDWRRCQPVHAPWRITTRS